MQRKPEETRINRKRPWTVGASECCGRQRVAEGFVDMDDHSLLCAATEEHRKFHITIQKGISLPISRKCSCCPSPLYHCPFCGPGFFKPTKQSKLKIHLNGHLKRAFFFEDYAIHRCGLSCRKRQHFHCLYCTATILRKKDLKIHLSVCFKKQMGMFPTPSHGSRTLLPTLEPGSVTPPHVSCPLSPSIPPSPASPLPDTSPLSSDLRPISEMSTHASCPPSPVLFQILENRKIDVLALLEFLNSAASIAGPGPSTGSAPTHRQCSIELKNDTSAYTLCSPSLYLHNGCCSVPFPPTIRPSSSGEAVFAKTPNTARGSSGVFTYDLLNNFTKTTSDKAAVLFVVPTDLNSISYAVGIIDSSRECNGDLFNEMYKTTNQSFVRSKANGLSLTHKGRNVTILATMSNCNTAVMKVEINES